jgi:hypothetical protein
MELRRTDPSPQCGANCSHRSELSGPRLAAWSRDANGPFKAGDEVWFGFSIYIPSDWIDDAAYLPGGGEILFQLHEQPDKMDWSRNRTSFLRLIAEAGNFRWIVYWDDCTAAQSCWKRLGVEVKPSLYTGTMTKDGWTDWVVHAKWSYTADGLLELWRDGVKVATYNGPNNYNTQAAGYLKIGLYKWDWHNPNIPVRIAWYDNLRIADQRGSYAAVAPR